MGTSLYDMSIGSYLQVVGGMIGVMEKGAEHCKANGIDLGEVVKTCLHPDMLDFSKQIVFVVHQSLGVVKGMHAGEFSPPKEYIDTDYAGLQAYLGDALTELKAITPDQINALAGGQVTFKMGELAIPFTTENFVLSFSLPNLYFHATTGYDILRHLGVPIGKRDYLGQMRVGV